MTFFGIFFVLPAPWMKINDTSVSTSHPGESFVVNVVNFDGLFPTQNALFRSIEYFSEIFKKILKYLEFLFLYSQIHYIGIDDMIRFTDFILNFYTYLQKSERQVANIPTLGEFLNAFIMVSLSSSKFISGNIAFNPSLYGTLIGSSCSSNSTLRNLCSVFNANSYFPKENQIGKK